MKVGHDFTGVSIPFYCTDGKGKFLLHKRSQKCRDEQGTWDVGGGRLKFGEDFEAGALREVKEEYGCDGKILEALPPYSVNRMHEGSPTHWIAIPFVVLVDPNEVKNNE